LVVGLVLGFFLSIRLDIFTIPVAIGAAILFGFLAVAFGERFWNALMKFGSWFGWYRRRLTRGCSGRACARR
jgi:hypothetical protein